MGFFEKLIGTGIDIVSAPVEVVKDVVTLGGVLTSEDEPYTFTRAKEVGRDVDELMDELLR